MRPPLAFLLFITSLSTLRISAVSWPCLAFSPWVGRCDLHPRVSCGENNIAEACISSGSQMASATGRTPLGKTFRWRSSIPIDGRCVKGAGGQAAAQSPHLLLLLRLTSQDSQHCIWQGKATEVPQCGPARHIPPVCESAASRHPLQGRFHHRRCDRHEARANGHTTYAAYSLSYKLEQPLR